MRTTYFCGEIRKLSILFVEKIALPGAINLDDESFNHNTGFSKYLSMKFGNNFDMIGFRKFRVWLQQ